MTLDLEFVTGLHGVTRSAARAPGEVGARGNGCGNSEGMAMASKKVERGLVVVGVDGSAHSVAALHWAARYAAASGAALRAVFAWHYPDVAGGPPVGVAPEPVRHQTEDIEQHHLYDAVAQVYPPEARDAVDAQIAYGHPAQVLIDMSKEADLLVVGGSGHSALTGMLLGSVSLHCVTHAFCPVTVVRGTDAYPGAAGATPRHGTG
jgi:nucleotide-binding universal stress UspA family protein